MRQPLIRAAHLEACIPGPTFLYTPNWRILAQACLSQTCRAIFSMQLPVYPSGLQGPSQGVARSLSSLTPDTMEDAIILPVDGRQLSALILAHRLAHANHFADNSSWGETLQSSPASLRRRVEMLLCAQLPTSSPSDFRPLPEQIVKVESCRACGRALLSLGGVRFKLHTGLLSPPTSALERFSLHTCPTVANYRGDESRSIRQSLLPLALRCERIAEFTCHSRRRKTHSSH